MKINWFSPLPPARTDIAHYTVRTLTALAERAQVTLWTDQATWDKRLEKVARVRVFRGAEINWTEFNRADVSFYHIGNNPLFHGGIWQVSQRAPGVVVLHDIRLHHFFDGLYRDQWRDRQGYFSLMEHYYGAESLAEAARCYDSNGSNINDMAERYPLTALACEKALGVLVHTPEAFAALRREAQQPVVYAPLPFAAPPLPAKGRRAPAPPYRLIIFGYLGRNRRLAQIFQALGELPEKEMFRLDIYGEVADRPDVEAALRRHKINAIAEIHGFVPEAKLDAALQRAHLAFNLRYPTMGEASGSQLRIWAHALPSLVTSVGWYAGLSREAVLSVRPEHEVADIKTHLQTLRAEPESLAALGAYGRALLETEHAPEVYAATLLRLAQRARDWRGKVWAYGLSERAARLMPAWQTAQELPMAQSKTAREIALLAGWCPPDARDYEAAGTAHLAPPAPARTTWREQWQARLDRRLLRARAD